MCIKKFAGATILSAVVLFALYCGSNGGGGNPTNDGGNDDNTPTTPTQYTLETNANPAVGGIVLPAGRTPHDSGTSVELIAEAAVGYEFVSWTGAGIADVNSPTTTILMNANRTVIANFKLIDDDDDDNVPNAYTVTVTSIGTGATGGGNYGAGETVSISAGTAPAGQRFVNWTSASAGVVFADADNATTMFTMPANAVTVTANFEELPVFTITYNGNGNTGGTAPTDNTQYYSGTSVTVLGAGDLTKTDHAFGGWNTEADESGNSFAAGNTFNITEDITLYARWVDVSIPIFTVNVNSDGVGSTGDGEYEEGATIHISAGTAPAGQQFRNWTTTSAGVTFDDENSAATTFTMPANAVTVTANFEPISTYAVTVSSVGTGAIGAGNYVAGATVSISAGTAPAGQRFVNWTTTSAGVTIANPDNAATSFIMPANAVTVTANFEPIPTFVVTVSSVGTGATGAGNYVAGARVNIFAGTAPTGYRFVNWTTASAGVTFANANNATTNFTMPANAVTVTANFEPIPAYAVTVSSVGTDATGAGDYVEGETVNIFAGTAPTGHRFVNWTTASEGVAFANANNATTSFTMPANAVTVTANFQEQTTPAHEFFTDTVNGVSFNMIAVEGGTFTMGCTDWRMIVPRDVCITSGDFSERPPFEVTLSSFYIGEFEVTQGLWRAVMGYDARLTDVNDTTLTNRGRGDEYPMYRINWNDVVNNFLPRLNNLTGRTYRLPTEAEWEYAARGGHRATDTRYAGSDNIDDVAWYRDNSNASSHPVGTKAPNELGIYDMSGNVREWLRDWVGSYTSTPKTDPTGPTSGTWRVHRGGSWWDDNYTRVGERGGELPTHANSRSGMIGFRLVLSAE